MQQEIKTNDKIYIECEIYKKALQDICRHQKVIGGGMYEISAVWNIANTALMEGGK